MKFDDTPETYYALYDSMVSKFIYYKRNGLQSPIYILHPHEHDAFAFSEIEILHYYFTSGGYVKVGMLTKELIDWIKENSDINNIMCVPCTETDTHFIHSFRLMEL